MNKSWIYLVVILTVVICMLGACKERATKLKYIKKELLFEDTGTIDWTTKWMLDGQCSKVINSNDGMELIAGPEFKNDTCHTVLWTKQNFEGNICIEYDYTRTDNEYRCVNILYFMATGKGTNEYPRDISLWNDKRVVPHMRTYFNNMNLYHISYAAFSNDNNNPKEDDYIRLRRYNPQKVGLAGTDVEGDHFRTGLFKTGVTYRIEVFLAGTDIEMHITNEENSDEKKVCKWDASAYPACGEGRIGLRHMYTRSARYKNFKVWRISKG